MVYSLTKIFASALIIFAVSEISRRSSLIAGILASLPLTSILALIWTHNESQDPQLILELNKSILLMILPSFVFFLALHVFLSKQMPFASSLIFSIIIMSTSYFFYYRALQFFKIVT